MIFHYFGIPDSEFRIVGGSDARVGQFPYQVSLRAVSSGRHFCGGSILTDRFVITAAHCTINATPTSLYVAVGSISLQSGVAYQASAVLNHEQFNANNIRNDLSLIKTETPMGFNEHVQPIRISEMYVSEEVQLIASGWGQTTNPGPVSNSLQFLTVRSISNRRCRSALSTAMVYESSVCTLTQKNEGLCMGDSGGPLVRETSDGYELVGLVSWGIPCARGKPDVFTRLSVFTSWIQNAIAAL